jgi:hydrogenase nickel incorporation protein HypA/HybF
MQSSQVAMSGAMSVRATGADALQNDEACLFDGVEFEVADLMQLSQRWRIARQRFEKQSYGGPSALDFDQNAGFRVADGAAEIVFSRKTIDIRAKAHTLHNSSDLNTQPALHPSQPLHCKNTIVLMLARRAYAHLACGAFHGRINMHELSIAYSLVELASQSAAEAGATRVLAVHVRLGALSGVVRGALEYCYEIATEGTPLAGSTLTFRELPVKVYCTVCCDEVELASVQRFRCPVCDTPSGDIRQGRELEIDSIEIDLPEKVI